MSSLDRSVGGAFRTPDSLFFADRAASGWTARLALVLAVVPFALGVVDLDRPRPAPWPSVRTGDPRATVLVSASGPSVRSSSGSARSRGSFPTGEPLPLPPYTEFLETRPVFGVLVLDRRIRARHGSSSGGRSFPSRCRTGDERLAGFVVALALLGLVAVGLAVFQPYALVFVLPVAVCVALASARGRLACSRRGARRRAPRAGRRARPARPRARPVRARRRRST